MVLLGIGLDLSFSAQAFMVALLGPPRSNSAPEDNLFDPTAVSKNSARRLFSERPIPMTHRALFDCRVTDRRPPRS